MMQKLVSRPVLAVWNYRHFILGAVRGEFKSRVARSRIGTLWFVLHPLAMAMIYALILSEVLGAKLGGVENSGGYAVFLLAGIAAWNFFAEIVNRCINIFIEYATTLKKINFPRLCLPVIILLGALINQLLLIIAISLIIAFYGYYPSLHWLIIIPLILVTAVLGLGIGILLGVLNVFSRDIAQVMLVVMNIWFWLTPIVYSIDMVPANVEVLISLNPVTPIVAAYQDLILYQTMPSFDSLIFPALLGVGFFVAAYFVFKQANAELVDAL